MQRTLEFGATIAQLKQNPKILEKFDADTMLDTARKVFGAPASMSKTEEELVAAREEAAQMDQMMQAVQMAQAGGAAAKAVGEGAQAVEGSPALAAIAAGMQAQTGGLGRLAGIGRRQVSALSSWNLRLASCPRGIALCL